MKRNWILALTLTCLVTLSACGGKEEAPPPAAGEDEFIVTVACSNKEIDQIAYSAYIDGEYRSMGGGIEVDGGSASSGCTLEFHFSAEDFQDEDDISQFSMTLSPYGREDQEEIATTEPVPISAEYGKTYTIDLSGDREKGFTADLKEV